MSLFAVQDRSLTCPHCHSRNILIGSDVCASTPVVCSHCGTSLGHYADLKPAPRLRDGETAPPVQRAS